PAWPLGGSERLTPAVAGVEGVPEPDLGLAVHPAQVALGLVAKRREVDQAAVEVAQHDAAVFERRDPVLELDERLPHDLARVPATVGRRPLTQRLARLLVRQPRTSVAQRGQLLAARRELA